MRFDDIYEVKHAAFGTAGAGDTELVAAVAGKSIIVLSFHLYSNGTTTVKLLSGLDYIFGSANAGAALVAGGQLAIESQHGALQTGVNKALIVNNSAAVGICGTVAYILA